MSATIRDVAEAAGVSTATVSRAMHGDPRVRPATAAHVRAVADRLQYAPSAAAARLAGGKAGHVTFVVRPEDLSALGPSLAAAAAVLLDHDLDTVLHVLDHDDAALGHRLRGRTDAVVVATDASAGAIENLLAAGLPAVVLGRDRPELPSVLLDSGSSGELAAHHLLSLGHLRLAVLAPSSGPGAVPAAVTAFEQTAAVREPGCAVQRLGDFDDDADEAERLVSALLSLPQPPTALFAATEKVTVGAARAFLRHGRLPGEGLALIGTGPDALSGDLGLTLVTPPSAELGRAVGRLIIARLGGVEASSARVVLQPQLVVRGSTGRSARLPATA